MKQMGAMARHRRTKNGTQRRYPSSVELAESSHHHHDNHRHGNDNDVDHDDDDAKGHCNCRHNDKHTHPHNHSHNHTHSHFLDDLFPKMIPSSIRKFYYHPRCNKVDLCAAGLLFLGITLLLMQWIGVPSLLQTTFQDSAQVFQRDRAFFDHPHSLPVLVVGGTDGSGTRAFVHTLKRLGVLIVADDPRTFDIHAAIMFRKLGWPKLITTVMEATNGSLHYEWETLPSDTQRILEREIRKLCISLASKYAENKRRMRLADSIQLRVRPHGRTPLADPSSPTLPQATGVAFAFKAPVAMLVLPLLTKFMGPIQFLHVVRDGRDIALSSNQSPVLKFYNATYPDYLNRSQHFQGELYPVRGIQLWNDWNVQVHQWSQKTIQKQQQQQQRELPAEKEKSSSEGSLSVPSPPSPTPPSPPPPFDYLIMRSEDLIDPSTRFDCFQRLARFVQSPLSPQELCCLAQMQPEDFGQSAIHSESTNNFAAHPDEWYKMGNARPGRSKTWSRMEGGRGRHGHEDRNDIDVLNQILYDDPDVDVDVLVDTDWNGKEKGVYSMEQDKYQQEIESLRAELAVKDHTIHLLESQLHHRTTPTTNTKTTKNQDQQSFQSKQDSQQQQQQEQDLQKPQPFEQQPQEPLQNEERQLEDSGEGNDQQQQEQQRPRRQLSETNTHDNKGNKKPRLVPTMFLKHFSTWQEHVMTSGQELSLVTLQKLLDFGGNLLRQYDLNAAAMESVVPMDEIKETCNYLKKLIQDRRKELQQRYSPKHGRGGGDQDEEALAIHERYGKWKTKLETQPILSKWLHREGRVGLQLFGYEPRQDWTYTVQNASLNSTATTPSFTCDKIVSCPRPKS